MCTHALPGKHSARVTECCLGPRWEARAEEKVSRSEEYLRFHRVPTKIVRRTKASRLNPEPNDAAHRVYFQTSTHPDHLLSLLLLLL